MDSYRCLVVDDEPLIRQLAVRHFTNLGFRCDSAADGLQASELLSTQAYDCALIDLQIPGKNGHAICVEALNLNDPPLVAVLTGLSVPPIEKDLRKRGVEHIYHKPARIKEIAHELRVLLDARIVVSPSESPPPSILPETRDADDDDSAESGGVPASAARGGANDRYTILVFCRDPERSQRLMSMLQGSGYGALACSSSDDLLETLSTTRVDLLVIDEKLRGFVNGIQIVQSLCEQLLSVSVILLRPEGERELPDVPAMGNVLRQLDTEMSDDDLAAAIVQVAKTATGSYLMIEAPARRLVADAEQIPPMPHVLAKIVRYLEQPVGEISLPDLAQDIEVDARLTSELLRVTNSSHAGVANKVTVVRDAIKLLGAKRAIILCLGLGVRTMNAELLKPWGDELRSWYLRRVTITASVASIFAQRFERVPHETAFLLGILQDVGILVFAEHYGEKYFTKVVQRVRSISSLVLTASERLVTNTDHGQVSAAVLRRWGLPPTIIEPVLMHHQPLAANQPKMSQSFVKCMRVAELFAEFADNPAIQRRKALNDYLKQHYEAYASDCGPALLDAVTLAQEMSQHFDTPTIDVETLQAAMARIESDSEVAEPV